MPVAAKDPIGALIRAANLSGEGEDWSGFEELMLQILVQTVFGLSLQPTCPLTNQLLSLLLPLFSYDQGCCWSHVGQPEKWGDKRFLLDHGVQPSNFASRLTVDDQLGRLSALFFPSFLQSPRDELDNRIHWRLIDRPNLPRHSISLNLDLGNSEIAESYDISMFSISTVCRADALPCPLPVPSRPSISREHNKLEKLNGEIKTDQDASDPRRALTPTGVAP
ncbi:uncharacterized protein B0J16DRAFT_188573 [Fusarium flagelliforme]|uniref:uncharacterized protein n=1 Tax=Fusarium flagelliforme TaxID=2675880 RepID=UPI001E8D88E9|nr:uncharacterized protein B0J16DRAFT_188573 [Fusarium flagelliforme]KAH7173293.1 hypothetical protein B0J16DRAFT_188573 [Fusarium flagelliforme]